MKFTIRKFQDEKLLKLLHHIIFYDDEYDLPSKTQSWFVFDENKMPIGFATCHQLAHDPDTIYFSRGGILEDFRGNGIHKQLIKRRLNWAKREGYKDVITYTTMDNYGSYTHLQKAGFMLYEPAEKYAGKVLYWYKKL